MTNAPPESSLAASPPRRGEPLRVAFIAAEDRKTGTYFRYHHLARALAARGHQVRVYTQSSACRWRGRRERRDGIEYVLAPSVPGNRLVIGPANPFNVSRRLLQTIEPADVYHLFQPFPTGAVPWLSLLRKRPGLFAYDWDDYWINDDCGTKHPRGIAMRWTAWSLNRMEQLLPSRAHLVTTLSHALLKLAEERGARRRALIYNGIWPEAPIGKRQARASLGLRPDALYVGLMGWSGEINWCLDGIRGALDRHPTLRLALCGQDFMRALSAYSDIRDRIDSLGLIPFEQTPAFKQSLDLALLPLADTDFNRFRLPFKFTDYLASGCPLLCSSVGETALLAEELEGVLTCAPNREAWLAAFDDTIDRIALGAVPVRVAPAEIERRFGWNRIAAEMEQAYQASAPVRLDSPQIITSPVPTLP
jgi:glycosyltransferase involved in cell wall biosynthesis